jgi:hypothetical protein
VYYGPSPRDTKAKTQKLVIIASAVLCISYIIRIIIEHVY